MKLDARQTRMLHTLGLTWLPMPAASTAAKKPAPAPQQAPQLRPEQPQAPNFKPNPTSVVESIGVVAPENEAIPLATTARSELDSASWDQLEQATAQCRACGLCASRRNTVFGEGDRSARVLVLGEAPGEHEDAQGRPFVGQAGQLLDNMLAALDWGRAEAPNRLPVYITNTLKCRPPGNRNPEPDELAQCAPILQRQVQLLKPKLILALGRFAMLQTLGSTEPLGRMRGRVHAAQIGGHACQVVVSYHPSYLLRSPAEKARAWEDLVLAADTLDQP